MDCINLAEMLRKHGFVIDWVTRGDLTGHHKDFTCYIEATHTEAGYESDGDLELQVYAGKTRDDVKSGFVPSRADYWLDMSTPNAVQDFIDTYFEHVKNLSIKRTL